MQISIEELMSLLSYLEEITYTKNKQIEESILEIHDHINISEERIMNKLASDTFNLEED